MITRIQYHNIKGKTGDHRLGKLSAILGANASGKTAALESVLFGMLGYSPRLRSKDAKGVPNAEMFRLCSGSFMSVRMETDAGVNTRRIDRKHGKDGYEYSKTEDAPVAFAPILNDSSLYFGLSPAKRVELVASLVPAADAGAFSVHALLAAVKNISLEPNTEASEAAIRAAYSDLAADQSGTPLEWLARNIEVVRSKLKAAVAKRKTLTATSIGITLLQSQDDEQAAVNASCETKLKQARVELGTAQEAHGKAIAAVDVARKAAARRQELLQVPQPTADVGALKATLVVLEVARDAARSVVSERGTGAQELFGKVVALESDLRGEERADTYLSTVLLNVGKRLDALVSVDVEPLKLRVAEVAAKIDAIQTGGFAFALVLAHQDADICRDKRATLAERWKAANAAVAATEAQIDAFAAHDKCPTCLAAGTGWKDVWLKEQNVKLEQARTLREAAKTDGAAVVKTLTEAEARIDAAKKKVAELAELRCLHSDLAGEVAKAERVALDRTAAVAERDAAATSQAASRTTQQSLKDRIAEARTIYSKAEAQDLAFAQAAGAVTAAEAAVRNAEAAQTRYAAVKDELARIGAVDTEAALHAAGVCYAKISALTARIAELEQQAKQVALQRADLRRQMDAARAATEAQAYVDVLKAVKELLEARQGDLVTSAFGKLLGVVNRFTSSIIPYPIEYRDGTVGYHDTGTGTFVGAETFNAAWELVLFVGLCVALASAAEHKVVVIDELSRLDRKNKAALAERLREMIGAGVIHQAVVVDLEQTDSSGGKLPSVFDAMAATDGDVAVIRV